MAAPVSKPHFDLGGRSATPEEMAKLKDIIPATIAKNEVQDLMAEMGITKEVLNSRRKLGRAFDPVGALASINVALKKKSPEWQQMVDAKKGEYISHGFTTKDAQKKAKKYVSSIMKEDFELMKMDAGLNLA